MKVPARLSLGSASHSAPSDAEWVTACTNPDGTLYVPIIAATTSGRGLVIRGKRAWIAAQVNGVRCWIELHEAVAVPEDGR